MVASDLFLLVCESPCICALPLASIVETMRPLPVQEMRGLPPFVLGLSVIRGQTVPVVRLGALLQPGEFPAAQRFVLLQVDGRRVALAVETVAGVFPVDPSAVQEVPMLRQVRPELIASVGSLDRELLLVLQASRIVPEDVWNALEERQREMQS